MKNFDKGLNLLIGKFNLNFNDFDVLQVFHFGILTEKFALSSGNSSANSII